MTAPVLERLESRDCPSAEITAPLLTQIEVGAVPDLSGLGPILAGPYTVDLAPWNIHSGSYLGTIHTGGNPTTDGQAQQLLAGLLQSGAIPANVPGRSEYLIYVPSPITDVGPAQAYHSYFWMDGEPVVYGVVWNNQIGSPFNIWSYAASHEYAEETVDPYGGNKEIADPAWPQSFILDGWSVAEFVLPNGSVFVPSPTAPLNLETLIGFVLADARYDYDRTIGLFAADSIAHQQEDQLILQASPWYGTLPGIWVGLQIDEAFGLP